MLVLDVFLRYALINRLAMTVIKRQIDQNFIIPLAVLQPQIVAILRNPPIIARAA